MERNDIYDPFKSPIAMETITEKRYTWQYKASPLLNTISRCFDYPPALLRILFYVTPIKKTVSNF